MATKKIPIEQQIREAERDKIFAEIDKIKSEKLKTELEYLEQSKNFQKPWFKKEKSWSLFAGALVALTSVFIYVTYSVLPLTEIKNNEANLENSKKSFALFQSEKKLALAFDSLRVTEIIVNIQKRENLKISQARHKVDSAYDLLLKRYLSKPQKQGKTTIDPEIIRLKQYLTEYAADLKKSYGLQSNFSNYTSSISPFPGSYNLNSFSLYQKSASSTLDSFIKAKGSSESLRLNISETIIRPLFNGALVKDLIIKVNYKSAFLSSNNDEIKYLFGQYVLPNKIYGDCTFEINDESYRIASIRTSNSLFQSDGNQIKVNSLTGENLKIDLLLEKR